MLRCVGGAGVGRVGADLFVGENVCFVVVLAVLCVCSAPILRMQSAFCDACFGAALEPDGVNLHCHNVTNAGLAQNLKIISIHVIIMNKRSVKKF